MAQGSVGHRPWATANKVTIYGLRALTPRLFGMRVMCSAFYWPFHLLTLSFASFRVRRNAFHFSYRCVCVCFFVSFLQSCSQKKTWNLCVVASIEQEFHTAHPPQQLHNKNNITTKTKQINNNNKIICVSSLDASCVQSKCAYPTDTSHRHHHHQPQPQPQLQQLHLTKV